MLFQVRIRKKYFRLVNKKMYDMSLAKAIVGAVSPTQVVQMGQVFHDKQAELARVFKGKNNQVQKLARNFCLAPKRWKPCSELVTLAGATGATLGATTPLLLAWAFRNVELVYDFLKQLEPILGSGYAEVIEGWGFSLEDLTDKTTFMNKVKKLQETSYQNMDIQEMYFLAGLCQCVKYVL